MSPQDWLAQYRAHGVCCPLCGEDGGTVMSTEGDDGLWQNLVCDAGDCEGTWTEFYTLTAIQDTTGDCSDLPVHEVPTPQEEALQVRINTLRQALLELRAGAGSLSPAQVRGRIDAVLS